MKRTKEPNGKQSKKSDTCILTWALMDMLLKEENANDLILLLSFYRYTAIWQKTYQPKATDSYCMRGLMWGDVRFRKAKAKLIELGLIEIICDKEGGQIIGWYVRMIYNWHHISIKSSERLSKGSDMEDYNDTSINITNGTKTPYNGQNGYSPVLEVNRINALSNKKKINALQSDSLQNHSQQRKTRNGSNSKPFIIDDGIRYNLSPDGYYRHCVSGDKYIP